MRLGYALNGIPGKLNHQASGKEGIPCYVFLNKNKSASCVPNECQEGETVSRRTAVSIIASTCFAATLMVKNGWANDVVNGVTVRHWYDHGVMARSKEVYDPAADSWMWFDAVGTLRNAGGLLCPYGPCTEWIWCSTRLGSASSSAMVPPAAGRITISTGTVCEAECRRLRRSATSRSTTSGLHDHVISRRRTPPSSCVSKAGICGWPMRPMTASVIATPR